MKIGIGTDPINAVSLRVALSRTLPADPARDRVKVHNFQDGSAALFDFGVREQLTAAFSVELLTKADFVTLVDYLSANEGSRVKVVEEWENERLFGPGVPAGSTGPSTYYVRILEHGQYSEAEWSATRGLFSANIKVLFAGVQADGSDEKAPAGSALLNALVRVDTVCADYIQAGDPGSVAEGSRWLRTGDRALLRRVSGGWGFLYTVAADDPSYGLVNGVFYWSAFCDEPVDLVAGVTVAHVAGWISAGSLNFGQENIDLGRGPAIAKKEGFTFSVVNSGRFHKYLSENGINFSGSRAYLSILRDNGGSRRAYQMRAGRVNTGKIALGDYSVECEPEVLNANGLYPAGVISLDSPRYADVVASAVGKPVFATFGEFGKAALQNVSSDRSTMSVARSGAGSSENVTAAIDRTYLDPENKHTRLLVLRSGGSSFQYDFTDEKVAALNTGAWCVQVFSDTDLGSDNPGALRRVVSIVSGEVSGYWSIYVDDEFPTLPPDNSGPAPGTDDRLEAGLVKMAYRFQMGEDVAGGFGTLADGVWTGAIHLWTLDENQKALVEIPVADFEVNADGNMVTLSPKVAADAGKVSTFAEIKGVNYRIIETDFSPLSNDFATAQTVDFKTDVFPLDPYWDAASKWTEIKQPAALCGNIPFSPWIFSALELHGGAPTFTQWDSPETKPLDIVNYGGGSRFTSRIYIRRFPASVGIQDLDNTLIFCWQYRVNHAEDALLVGLDNLRLGVSFDVASWAELVGLPIETSGVWKPAGKGTWRWWPVGFRLRMRLRKLDGSYIEPDGGDRDWIHDVTADQLGTNLADGLDTQGNNVATRPYRVNIDNMPGAGVNGEPSGFTAAPPSLIDVFPPFSLQDIVTSTGDLPYIGNARVNDRVWVISKGQIYKCTDTSPLTWSVDPSQPAPGEIMFLRHHYYYYSTNATSLWYKAVLDYTVIPGERRVIQAVAYVDYIPFQTKKGRDLFDLSSVISTPGSWGDVAAIEFALSPIGINDGDWRNAPLGDGTQYYNFDLIETAPRFFTTSDFEVKDRPLFSDVRGSFLSGAFPTPAADVTASILGACYPGGYSVPALDALFALPSRSGWIFRKQFTAQKRVDEVLSELLRNLWAVAVISDDDLLELQSLAPDDHGRVSLVLTDGNILEDSAGPIEQRESEDIFQRFELSFDYFPPSSASAALQKWNRVEISSPDVGTTEEKMILSRSAAIWSRREPNVKREGLEYHYAAGPLPLNTWVVKWHSLNSWLVEVTVPLDHVLGPNGLRLMSRVLLRSYFLSGGQDLDAFVVRRRPDIYSASCVVGLYIWAPPGYLGGFLDYYNDALNIETRDITLWTDGNGKRNDAGQIEARGTLAEKDAGQIETRTF